MRDGDIDYSRYTLRELEEAFASINRHQYPLNYSNLLSAHGRLMASLAQTQPQEAAATESDGAARVTGPGLWERFWDSRPIAGLLGVFCFWWAYDLFTKQECPSGRKLAGVVIGSVCENVGPEVAAGIPFVLGLVLVAYAAVPRQPAGA